MAYWEHFPHGSDIGIRGVGSTLPEAFHMVANALTALMANPHSIRPSESISFQLESANLDFLLYDWVNRLIFETATKKLIFGEFHIDISKDPPRLSAHIEGEKINPQKHEPGVEVKGATFTELKVEQQGPLWLCQCIVDV